MNLSLPVVKMKIESTVVIEDFNFGKKILEWTYCCKKKNENKNFKKKDRAMEKLKNFFKGINIHVKNAPLHRKFAEFAKVLFSLFFGLLSFSVEKKKK